MTRPGFCVIVVGSFAVEHGEARQPPPETVATFVSGVAASDATLTVTSMVAYEFPAASTSERVQVGSAVHVQPVPLMAVTVRPVGAVSVTVTVEPSVGPTFVPEVFVTVSV